MYKISNEEIYEALKLAVVLALGLLAPMSATANEVTINDFAPAEELAVTNSRVDGLEARVNNFAVIFINNICIIFCRHGNWWFGW